MNIDTFTLHCFLSVLETGSFTKAAERVGRTQSAVTQQIAKLEYMLGKPLFIRGRVLRLTPQGDVFHLYAQKIYVLHRELVDRLKEPSLQGEVRFGLPEDFASVFLSDVLADFARTHPRILLNIECDLTLNLWEKFKNKQLDLVLLKMPRPEDFPHGFNIWEENLEWVGNGSDHNAISNLDDPIPLVLSPKPCIYRQHALRTLEESGQKWRLAFSSPSYTSTIAAVKAGMGISVLPHTMIPESLIRLSLKNLSPLEKIHVSLLKSTNQNAAVNSLEEFVLQKLK